MITYNFPPKPGEVTLDVEQAIGLLYLKGHAAHREALIAGAGYTIGSLLTGLCESDGDLNEIVGELTDQARAAFELHNHAYDPTWVDASVLAANFNYGMQMGRTPAAELPVV